MDNNELKHYGVLGMKWGRRKGKKSSSSTKRVSEKRSDDSEKNRNKVNRGAKTAAKILAISGGLAITAFAIKKAHDQGYAQAKNEASLLRKAAAQRGAITRSVNKARLQNSAARVDKILQSVGTLRPTDYMRKYGVGSLTSYKRL